MRKWLAVLGLTVGWAQLYETEELVISFYSDAPLEKITAENRGGCFGWVNFATDSVYVQVWMRGFSFPNKLMERHFNELYVESDKYPYAYFRGKLVASFPYTKVGTYAVSAKGVMEIHGVKRQEVLSGVYEVKPDGRLKLTGRFFLHPADYGVKVPTLLWQQIAKQVEVSFHGIYRASQ